MSNRENWPVFYPSKAWLYLFYFSALQLYLAASSTGLEKCLFPVKLANFFILCYAFYVQKKTKFPFKFQNFSPNTNISPKSNYHMWLTQHQEMRWMSTKFILRYVNRCAVRSKFVKFFMMASDDLWYIFPNSQGLRIMKIRMEMLVCMDCFMFAPLPC